MLVFGAVLGAPAVHNSESLSPIVGAAIEPRASPASLASESFISARPQTAEEYAKTHGGAALPQGQVSGAEAAAEHNSWRTNSSTLDADTPDPPEVMTGSNRVVYWLPPGKEGDLIQDQAGLASGNMCAGFGATQCTFERVDLETCNGRIKGACGMPSAAVHAKSAGADVVIVPVQVATAYAQLGFPSNSTTGGSNVGLGHGALSAMGGNLLKEEYLPARPATRVLYWRESYDQVLPPSMQTQFDLLMGHQYFASILNPSFFVGAQQVFFDVPDESGPDDWLEAQRAAMVPLQKRPGMAISIVSHCKAPSARDEYLDELSKYIALDRFGKCGESRANQAITEPFPVVKGKASFVPPVISFGAKYKFYLAFENEIADGYVTEKLLENPLVAGAIPVHLGSSKDLPSIDGKGSLWYISAMDFKSPKDLGEYLNKIATTPGEMYKYVSWRAGMDKHSVLFPQANSGIKKSVEFAGKVEWYGNHKRRIPSNFAQTYHQFSDKIARARAVCSLCDAGYVASLKETTPLRPIDQALTIEASKRVLGIGA